MAAKNIKQMKELRITKRENGNIVTIFRMVLLRRKKLLSAT